jgi:hypothetical protein
VEGRKEGRIKKERRKERKKERRKERKENTGPFILEILRQKMKGGTANPEETLGEKDSCLLLLLPPCIFFKKRVNISLRLLKEWDLKAPSKLRPKPSAK